MRRTGRRATPQRRTPPQPAGDARSRSQRQPGRFTSRAAVLGLVVCAMVLTLAYPLKEYLAQRSQIAHLEQQTTAKTERVAALEQRKKEWQDPAYVKAQATKRLQYVMPGEVAYVVIDPSQKPAPQPKDTSHTVTPSGSTKHSPWYSQLWSTVQAADGK